MPARDAAGSVESLLTGETNPYVETQPAFIDLVWGTDGRLTSFRFGPDTFTRDEGAPTVAAGSGGGSQVALDHAVALLATNARELLEPAVAVLMKLVGNVADKPEVVKYRTIKTDNPKIATALQATGATEFLLACGWKRDAASTLAIPEHSIVPGRLKAAQQSLTDVVVNADMGGASAYGGGAGQVEVPHGHFQCSACRRVVCNDDTLDFSGGGGGLHMPQGEFKYACYECDGAYNICRKCFDSFRQGRLAHDKTHTFEHIAPKTNEYGWGRGLPPPPPPPNRRNVGGWKN